MQQRKIVEISAHTGIATLDCGHAISVGDHHIGEEAHCPYCDGPACAVCGNPAITTNIIMIQDHPIQTNLCRFCATGVGCTYIQDVNTFIIVRHISLVAHELLKEMKK